ncbi:hypothetical protein BpHYR1_039466 [Brachionus plicatilis]|uniref:Uncharacterized protein n=1 Tax=Brachionus plicatilis TaxID=10195 RepID=A0A3M7P9R2_BRAPC|nr:hypothetical protein BpHYR1_039466 [Brachionus plicatilis]
MIKTEYSFSISFNVKILYFKKSTHFILNPFSVVFSTTSLENLVHSFTTRFVKKFNIMMLDFTS